MDRWPLGRNEVHVWLLDPALVTREPIRTHAVALLDLAERERHERLRFERDRDVFLATRVLVRTVLSRYTGTPARALAFEHGPYGKPSIAPGAAAGDLEFNASNTRGLVACAVTRGRAIGVDVETMRDAPLEIVQHSFAAPEIAALEEMPPGERRRGFFAYWTLKEAFLKAHGMGLSLPLAGFAVALSPPRLLALGVGALEAEQWQFQLLTPTESHTLAVCVRSDRSREPTVVCRELTGELIQST